MDHVHAPISRRGNSFSFCLAAAAGNQGQRRTGVDSNRHGSAHERATPIAPRRATKQPGSWLTCARGHVICALLGWLGLGLSVADVPVYGQSIALYDNLLDGGTGHGIWPEAPDEIDAQPFETGDSDNISSVTIRFRRLGNPSGVLSVEIWDDKGSGVPGELVGVVGTIDVASLSALGAPVTFSNRVTGLTPRSTYYVVLNPVNANISASNSYAYGTFASDDGTQGASYLLFKTSGNWVRARDFFSSPDFSYLHMAVTAESTNPSSVFLRGDCNDDGILDISDAVCVLDWLFLGAESPNCVAGTNANGDEAVDLSDPVRLLNFLFAGGSPPEAPFPACGPGSLAVDIELGCENTPKSCQ